MSAALFRLVLLRATLIDGRHYAAGAELVAGPDAARGLIESRAARLADARDLTRLVGRAVDGRPAHLIR